MIQRIQTVHLLTAAVAVVIIPFLDIVSSGVAARSQVWFVPAIAAIGALLVVGLLASVFLYANRRRQLRVVAALQFGVILLAAVEYGGLYLAGALRLTGSGSGHIDVWIAVALPIVSYVGVALARRAIQKDIDLVRSMDRLRD